MSRKTILERPLLICLAFVQFTNVLDFMIMMPMSPLFAKDFGITPTQFGILVASYNLSAGIVSFFSSLFVDRFDRRRVMLLSYAFFITGTFVCGISSSYAMLLVARIITGMFGGVLAAVVLSIVGDVIPPGRRASAIGTVMGGFAAASIIGVPLGSYVASHVGWHIPFFAIAIMGIIVFAGILFFIPNMTGHIAEAKRRSPFAAFSEILLDSNRLRGLLLMALLMFGHFAIIPYIPQYMVANVGMRVDQISLIYLVGGLCSVVVLRVVGKLSDRYGSFRIYAILSFLALFPIFAVTNMPKEGLAVSLFICAFIFIFSGSRSVPANTLITATAEPHQRGGFLSLNAATQQFAAGLASFCGGLMISEGPNHTVVHYPYIGIMSAIASMVAIPVAYYVRPVKKQNVPVEAEAEMAGESSL
jgi:multidrug resistance protein